MKLDNLLLPSDVSLSSGPSRKEDDRKKLEEKKQERQKAIEAKRAAKKGPLKLGAKKAAFD